MGVGEPVMTLMRKTSAASIRWLSRGTQDSHLVTLALDPAEPILTSGANGLNAHALEGDPPRDDLVQASLVRTVPGGGATIEVTFRYRPAAARSRWRRSSAVSICRRRPIGPLRV